MKDRMKSMSDGSSASRSPSGDKSLSSKDRWSRRRDFSPSSCPDRLSPLSKRWRAMSRSPGRCSYSHDDRWRSPAPRCHRASPQSTASRRSHSPAPRRRSRRHSSLSRRSSPPSMTRRPAKDVSLSPRLISPYSLARRSSCHTSPRTRRISPNRYGLSSTPHPSRRPRSRSRSPRSRSSTWDRLSRPYAVDQCRLRLRDVSPVPQQEDDPEDDQNPSADDTRMSAEAVRKLFADLVSPPALSHYTDPFPNTDMTNTQLVPYVKDAAKSKTVSDTDELDTQNSLFQNYQRFTVFPVIKTVKPAHLLIMNWWTQCSRRRQKMNS